MPFLLEASQWLRNATLLMPKGTPEVSSTCISRITRREIEIQNHVCAARQASTGMPSTYTRAAPP